VAGDAVTERVRLLAGGNPQIAKADGDEPVQAYIAAMPGWKSDVGRQVDALVERTVLDLRKAVKWNNPLYGVEGGGFFMSYRCFTRYVKVTFFRGGDLRPLPPVASKDPHARHVHVHEGDELDEERLGSWIEQASRLPGWVP
jgi:hypothetical protein